MKSRCSNINAMAMRFSSVSLFSKINQNDCYGVVCSLKRICQVFRGFVLPAMHRCLCLQRKNQNNDETAAAKALTKRYSINSNGSHNTQCLFARSLARPRSRALSLLFSICCSKKEQPNR